MPSLFPIFARGRTALLLAVLLFPRGEARAGTVRTITGESLEGEVRLDNGAVAVTAPGQPVQRIDLANVRRADFRNEKSDAASGIAPGVQLRDGAVIAGKAARIDASAVHLMVAGQPMDYPLASVARVVFAPLPAAVADKIPAGFVGAVLPGGDLFEGECRGMDDRPPQVRVNSPLLGVHRFGLDDQAILALAFHDLAPAAPDAYRVRTVDGSAYGVTSLQATGDLLTLHDPMAGEVKIPAKQLAEIAAGPGRVLPLGSLRAQVVGSANPAKVPAVVAVDSLMVGGPIALAGQSYDGGIAQAAGVAVTYAVPPGFDVFTARAGLPAGAPAGAAVVFALLVDGRSVWRSPPVAAGAAPLPVRWNLGGSLRTLSLAVEPAQPAFLGTPAVWADATLLKH